MKEVVGVWALVCLVSFKICTVGELVTISRSWPTLGGALQDLQGPRCQSIRIQKIKDTVNTPRVHSMKAPSNDAKRIFISLLP